MHKRKYFKPPKPRIGMNNMFLIVLVLLVIVSSFVVGQEDIKIPGEPIPQTYNTQSGFMGSAQADLLFFPLIVFSLILGITIIIYMIKKSPKTLNLIINGLILLIGAVSLIWYLFSSLRYGYFDYDFLEFSMYALPLYILCIYFLVGLLKNNKFEKSKKWGLNLFGGAIITSAFIVLSSIITLLIYPPIGFGGLAILIFALGGAVLSFVLGIVGLVIDKIRAK